MTDREVVAGPVLLVNLVLCAFFPHLAVNVRTLGRYSFEPSTYDPAASLMSLSGHPYHRHVLCVSAFLRGRKAHNNSSFHSLTRHTHST